MGERKQRARCKSNFTRRKKKRKKCPHTRRFRVWFFFSSFIISTRIAEQCYRYLPRTLQTGKKKEKYVESWRRRAHTVRVKKIRVLEFFFLINGSVFLVIRTNRVESVAVVFQFQFTPFDLWSYTAPLLFFFFFIHSSTRMQVCRGLFWRYTWQQRSR